MFGEPVYDSAQRRSALAELKRYIDLRRKRNKRKRNNLPRNINLIRPYKRRAAPKGRKRRKKEEE